MNRSRWKGPFYDNSVNLSKKLGALKPKKKTIYKENKTMLRNALILSSFIGKVFNVYNGKIYKEVLVDSNMIYKKFGEFVFTRAAYVFKKKKKKAKKKK